MEGSNTNMVYLCRLLNVKIHRMTFLFKGHKNRKRRTAKTRKTNNSIYVNSRQIGCNSKLDCKVVSDCKSMWVAVYLWQDILYWVEIDLRFSPFFYCQGYSRYLWKKLWYSSKSSFYILEGYLEFNCPIVTSYKVGCIHHIFVYF